MTRWKLVPVEPTEEMENAGWIDKEDVCPCDIYSAMLSAAPSPEEDEGLMMRIRFAVSDPGRIVGARDANETLQNWQARAVLKALEG